MKKLLYRNTIYITCLALTLILTACSAEKEVDNSNKVIAANTPTNTTTTAKPIPTGSATSNNTGKVIKAMHAGGYTYMQVENHGKQFWIAAKMMNVKRNDHIVWSDAALMKDFTSSTLRRTFDEILFVSTASVE